MRAILINGLNKSRKFLYPRMKHAQLLFTFQQKKDRYNKSKKEAKSNHGHDDQELIGQEII